MLSTTNTVIAYPIDSSPHHDTNLMEDSIYGSSLGDSNFADNTIEMGTNFFSQLDSMIAAVKVESSALDSMKEKLKEVENLRNQISNFTKRLLDADQTNLNLKSNLVKAQEMYAEIKKSKAEIESTIVPIRQELNRVKEQCNKERTGRLAAQQQVTQLKDQIAHLENMNEMLDREVKSIPALNESNEILKNDLSSLRKRYKDEKNAMQKHIKLLENQSKDVEVIRGCVRELSLKLLDVCNNNNSNNNNNTNIRQQSQVQQQQSNRYISTQQQPSISYQQQQQHQQQGISNVYYETMDGQNNEDEYEEDYDDDEENNNAEYVTGAYLDEEGSQVSGMGDSIHSMKQNSMEHSSLVQAIVNNTHVQTGGGKKKKKNGNTVRRVINNTSSKQQQLQQQGGVVGTVRTMQQLSNNNNNNIGGGGNQGGGFHTLNHHQDPNHHSVGNNSNYPQQQHNNMTNSFSLPRI